MAKYKVWLTVKDRYGSIKELDAGNIEVENKLSDEDISKLNLPVYVPDVSLNNILKYTLKDDITEKELQFDIDKSNDWNGLDGTVGSNYMWEPME